GGVTAVVPGSPPPRAAGGRRWRQLAGVVVLLALACLPLALLVLSGDPAGPEQPPVRPPARDTRQAAVVPVKPEKPAVEVKKQPPTPEEERAAAEARARREAEQAVRQARELLEQKHDYAAAARVLGAVPESLRDADLYREACARRDQVARLEKD